MFCGPDGHVHFKSTIRVQYLCQGAGMGTFTVDSCSVKKAVKVHVVFIPCCCFLCVCVFAGCNISLTESGDKCFLSIFLLVFVCFPNATSVYPNS